MTEVETRLLPYAATWAGRREPMNTHLVLTGPGGGTWDIAAGRSPPRPAAIAIVTDAVGFCRLAGNRSFPAELDLPISADPGRAARMLAVVSALALGELTDSPAG